MTNKLIIATIVAVVGWIGHDVAAQQSDTSDAPSLDQQVQGQPDMGPDRLTEKRRGKRGRQARGRRGGPEMLKKVFARMDKDGDGLISIDEAPERLREKMPKLDTNADGGCDMSELQTAMKNRGNGAGKRGPGMPGQDQARRGKRKPGADDPGGRKRGGERSLDRFDTDGDGKISKAEAPERMQQRFEMIDTDGDGFINKTEQEALLQKMSERGGKGGRGGDGGANKQGQKPKRPDPGA